MPRSGRRKRHILLIIVFAAVSLGVGLGLRWGKSRLFPGFAARASTAMARGDWDQASVLIRERLKKAPDDPIALQLAARAAARQDRDQTAIAIYSRLILEDMDAEDLYLLGRALSRTGKPGLACKTYERARLVNPDHPETLYALAQLYLQDDRENAAEEVGERLARQPGWEARGQLVLGTARAALNDPAGVAGARAVAAARSRGTGRQSRSGAARSGSSWRDRCSGAAGPRRPGRVLANLLAQRAGRRGIVAARPLLHPGTGLGSGRRPARAGRCPFAPSIRSRSNPPRTSARLGARSCHPEIYRSAIASKHATTFSRAQDLDKLILPSDPVPDPGNHQVTHDFKRRDGSLQVETRAGGEVQRAVIDYAFGSRDHFMTFVGRDDRGRSRMIRISHFQSPRGSGWDLATGLPTRPEDPHEYLGTTMLEGDGVRRCLFCHTTNFRAVLDQTGPEAADHRDRLREVPRAGRSSCRGGGGRVRGPGHRQSRAAAGSRGQQDVRSVPRPPRHQRDLGAPDRPRLVPLPIAGSDLEPMLHRERGQPELRDLPRPAHLRQDLDGPPGSEVPLLSWSRSRACERGPARRGRIPCRRRHRQRKRERLARSIPPRGASSATCRAPGSSPRIPSRPITSFASATDLLRGNDGLRVELGRSARRPRSRASEIGRAQHHADGHEKVGQQTRRHRARDDRVVAVAREEHAVDHLEGDGRRKRCRPDRRSGPSVCRRDPRHPQPSARPAAMPTTAQMPPRTRNGSSRDGVSSL